MNKKQLRWLLPLVALPILWLLYWGMGRDTYVLPSPMAGLEAPEFHLVGFDGDTLSLADLRGRVVILNFWASWCIPCRTEHPVLVQTERTWDDSEVVLLGVVYQDSRANAERFLAQYGGEWTHVLDPSQRTAIDYGVYGVPETFFIGRDGHISHKKVGPVTWDLVRYQVDSLLAAPVSSANAGSGGGTP
jgi:cytochrome c biogenesis protein CcmG/thiol:disulfide interchange protein DsbE